MQRLGRHMLFLDETSSLGGHSYVDSRKFDEEKIFPMAAGVVTADLEVR